MFETAIELLNNVGKRFFGNILTLMPFWFLSLMLFKADFLTLPIYAQGILTFCFSFIWYVISCVFVYLVLGFERIIKNHSKLFLEFATFVGIFSICIFIIVGYYCSYNFKTFLLKAFPIMFFNLFVLSTKYLFRGKK